MLRESRINLVSLGGGERGKGGNHNISHLNHRNTFFREPVWKNFTLKDEIIFCRISWVQMLCELICTLAFENDLLISPSSFSSKVCPIYFLWRKITQTLELVWFKSTTPPSPSGWGLSYNFTNEYLKELILEIRNTKSRMSIFAPINGYVSCSVSSNALGNVNTETLINF